MPGECPSAVSRGLTILPRLEGRPRWRNGEERTEGSGGEQKIGEEGKGRNQRQKR